MSCSKEINYKCLFCGFVCEDLDVIKSHEESLHGCFRESNPRKTKSRKIKPVIVDAIWYAMHLPLFKSDFKIDVLYEIYSDGNYRMYTDDLKYGSHLEIIYDKDIGMYNIKNIDKLREMYYRNLGEDVVTDVDSFERFRDEVF